MGVGTCASKKNDSTGDHNDTIDDMSGKESRKRLPNDVEDNTEAVVVVAVVVTVATPGKSRTTTVVMVLVISILEGSTNMDKEVVVVDNQRQR